MQLLICYAVLKLILTSSHLNVIINSLVLSFILYYIFFISCANMTILTIMSHSNIIDFFFFYLKYVLKKKNIYIYLRQTSLILPTVISLKQINHHSFRNIRFIIFSNNIIQCNIIKPWPRSNKGKKHIENIGFWVYNSY